ncbi:hypothetical protein [Sphaerisporangium sp. TRM90804]|uniref:hypothetical protein n=1 Tax=Sphaerisporangium sp. TRM90804 TaxID=3031113 RepID=UPI00244BF19B|nr:hypothetical protein [Sphaerisporangium sp. TRM90804]MDH2430737.1 hypothetical protein [Sphaerisporangium sp. TRM90804]
MRKALIGMLLAGAFATATAVVPATAANAAAGCKSWIEQDAIGDLTVKAWCKFGPGSVQAVAECEKLGKYIYEKKGPFVSIGPNNVSSVKCSPGTVLATWYHNVVD